ncbi:hypothetical protein [Shimazuella kribbensis]|uniref:hypothetical protein n=1 Tax=Shimazuella kribbensis TaxID=139808 RepID=UPI000408CF4C|nr:hypothetical protein [Shimazuella kribbensis]
MNKKIWLWLISIFTFIGVGLIYSFVLTFWLSKNYSPEVDAAVITALVTIPLGLATLLGTVWISVVSNRKTVETAMMQQRTTIRDQLFIKRIEVYNELLKQTWRYYQFNQEKEENIKKYETYVNWLYEFYFENLVYLSKDIRLLIQSYVTTSPFSQHANFIDPVIHLRDCEEIYKKTDCFLKEHNLKINAFDIILTINSINQIPHKWFKQNLNVNIKDPSVKKDVILKRFVGFLYDKRFKKDIHIYEGHHLWAEGIANVYIYLNYLIMQELDFKYIETDIHHLYYQENR